MRHRPSAEERLTELFTAHHRQVVAYVARRTRPLGDQAVAQDVASETYAVAWQRLSAADPAQVTLPWLLVTARNVLSQRVRDDARRAVREERAMTDRSAAGRTSSATDPADALALSEQVARALDRMAPDDRELLLLRVWDELPFADVAGVLGCSPGAARVRWLRARRRFAAALTREDTDSATEVDTATDPSPPRSGVIPLPLTTTSTGEPR